MSDRVEFDAGRPSTLRDGENVTHCTFQEAVIALDHLPIDRQQQATIQVEGGAIYTARDIKDGIFHVPSH